MPDGVATEAPIAKIQVEAIDSLARGFDKRDHPNESEHRETLGSLVRSIATGESTEVKVEGLKRLGDYSVRTGSKFAQIQSVQDEAVENIAAISVDDSSVQVKDVGLDQVGRRLDMEDYRDGEVHGGAIDAIRKIATSVTVSEADQTGVPLVQKAIEVLSKYSTRTRAKTGSEFAQIASVQEQAKRIIHLITTTVGVEKFADLKQ